MTAYAKHTVSHSPPSSLEALSKRAKEEKAKRRAIIEAVHERRRLSYIRFMEKLKKHRLQASSDVATIA